MLLDESWFDSRGNHFQYGTCLEADFHSWRQKYKCMQTCTQTDQVDLLFCILIFSVVLQRDMCGAQDWRRTLAVAIAVLWEPQVAQWRGSGAVHTGWAVQEGHLDRERDRMQLHFSCKCCSLTFTGALCGRFLVSSVSYMQVLLWIVAARVLPTSLWHT